MAQLGKNNLICNGNFENYKLTMSITNDGVFYNIGLFSNNNSCWWATAGTVIEVIKTQYGTGSQSADFSSVALPYALYQYVNLGVGKKYNISFDSTSLPRIKISTIYTYLNDKLVLTTVNSDYKVITQGYL